jgi:hypothetical protein
VTFLGITGALGLADGLLNTPRGVFATATAQYVASSGNHRIDAFGTAALQRIAPLTPELAQAPAPGESQGVPFEVELLPLGPDPRDLTAVARFQVPRAGRVRIELEGAAGRSLGVVHDAELAAGVHEVTWKPDGLGRSAGVESVRCRLETADARAVRAIALP